MFFSNQGYRLVLLSATVYYLFPNSVEKAAMIQATPEQINIITGAKIIYSNSLKIL